jgi:dTMP kinase
VVTTREPGGTPEGQALRELLLGARGQAWDPWSELLLMTAGRVQHVRKLIIPAMDRGSIVISDRFVGSTIAYQGAGRGMPAAEILRLHAAAVGDFWPDLTIILDIDPRIGVRRSLARLVEQKLDEGRFEAMDLEFHDRVRTSFLEQAAARPDSHVVVDAGQSVENVADTVWSTVSRKLRLIQTA